MTALPLRPPTAHARQMAATAIVVVAVLTVLAGALPARAHASLVRAEPADGTVVAAAPAEVALAFNEAVAPLALRLVGPGGEAVDLDRYRLDGATLRIGLPPGLGDGTYALSWRAVSEDGHPVGGTLVFSLGAPSTAPPAALADTGAPMLDAAIWAARLALYLGLFAGVGGTVFAAWIAGPPGRGGSKVTAPADGPADPTAPGGIPAAPSLRALVAAALVLGLAAAPLSVGLQGLDALGAPLGRLVEPIVWQAGLSTRYGATAVIAALALLAGLAALALLPGAELPGPGGAPRAGAATDRALSAAALGLSAAALAAIGLALAAIGLALAASGHAASAEPRWLTRPSVFLHAVGIAVWIGALAPLAVMIRRGDGDAALARFSRLIPFALAPLVVAGGILAVVQVGAPAALWSTAYGRVLVAKLALVALLFALAAWNRFRLTRPALAGDAAARRRLVRSIAAETGLAVAIIAIAALWRFTPPPRSLAAAAAAPAEIHIHAAAAMADLSVVPGRVGPVAVGIVVMTGDFGPLDPQAVRLSLANPTAGIEPIRRAATRPGADGTPADGVWRVDGVTIPVPGRWTVRLDILVSDFSSVRLDGEIDIRP